MWDALKEWRNFVKGYTYIDDNGSFSLENPELTSYLYFPIANESGVMSSVTPYLGGDNKISQNAFLLQPVSSEELHNNKSSRNFWCKIEGKGVWSATGKSSLQQAAIFTDKKDETHLEAGFMWHKLTRSSKEFGIRSEILSFVPHTKDKVELMVVTITNEGEDKIITPTVAIPLYGRSADNIRDHKHVTSLLHRVEMVENGVILNPTLTFDERGHQNNTLLYGVFAATKEGENPEGFFPCVEDFIGEGGSLEQPRAIYESNLEPVKAGTTLDGYETLGGIRFSQVTLGQGESKTYVIALGYGEEKDSFLQSVNQFLYKEGYQGAYEATKEYWAKKVNIRYHSASSDFDNWMSWVNFQPMLRRIYGCSFLPHHDYGKGGRGYRDLWQDCLALLMMSQEDVRGMLLDNFGGIRMDGTNATIIGSKQGEFIADRNNITRVWMDHGVWPFLTTQLYIMQSGDIEILLNQLTYFKDKQAGRGDEKDLVWKLEDGNKVLNEQDAVYEGSLLEHLLLQHLGAFYDVGEHNYIRIRGADWNDALDMAKERGESVAFTNLYGSNLINLGELLLELDKRGVKTVALLKEMAPLLEDSASLYNDLSQKQNLLKAYCDTVKNTVSGQKEEYSTKELAENLIHKGEWIKEHIRKSEWISNKEGYSWFNGYYDNSGRRVEGDHENGVRMMLTSQVFAIMSGTATKEQVEEIVKAADYYLYEKKVGGYKLNTNFNEIKTDLGRMFGFAYGSKENGAVFAHMAVMYANALYQRGFVPEGYKVINTLYEHIKDFETSKIYPGIPEYIGDNGRGLYHYLTGSASWLLLTVLTEMYGVKGVYGNLGLEPKLLLEQFNEENKALAELVFAGRKVKIVYHNDSKLEYGQYKVPNEVFVDKKEYSLKDGQILREDIQALEEEDVHVIDVYLV